MSDFFYGYGAGLGANKTSARDVERMRNDAEHDGNLAGKTSEFNRAQFYIVKLVHHLHARGTQVELLKQELKRYDENHPFVNDEVIPNTEVERVQELSLNKDFVENAKAGEFASNFTDYNIGVTQPDLNDVSRAFVVAFDGLPTKGDLAMAEAGGYIALGGEENHPEYVSKDLMDKLRVMDNTLNPSVATRSAKANELGQKANEKRYGKTGSKVLGVLSKIL